MSDSPAHWDEIGKAVKLRDSMKSKTLIIGNGDVKTREDAMEKYKKVLQNLHFRPASPKLPPRLGEAGQRGEHA